MTMKCLFCEDLSFWLKQETTDGCSERYKASLIVETYGKDEKKPRSRVQNRARNLNYCPTCGRRLKL